MKLKSVTTRFVKWVFEQRDNKKYNYYSSSNCPLAQFGKKVLMGRYVMGGGATIWVYATKEGLQMGNSTHMVSYDACLGLSRFTTFGALKNWLKSQGYYKNGKQRVIDVK